MKIKLNGWQRVGVVLNAIYLIIIIIIAWYEWPTQKQIESSWVCSALNAIRKPESPSAYELMEGRFKDISDRELIKRINLEYKMRKPAARELIQAIEADKLKPQQQSTIEQTGTPRPPDFGSIKSRTFNIQGARKDGCSDSEIADYLAKINNFNLQGARKAGYSDNEIIDYFSHKNLNSVTDPFIIAQLEGELVTLGKKQSINLPEGFVLDDELQCQEKLEKVNLLYQKEIETLGINRLKIVGIAFMAWIIPSGIVYFLGFSIGWIYRGFKEK